MTRPSGRSASCRVMSTVIAIGAVAVSGSHALSESTARRRLIARYLKGRLRVPTRRAMATRRDAPCTHRSAMCEGDGQALGAGCSIAVGG